VSRRQKSAKSGHMQCTRHAGCIVVIRRFHRMKRRRRISRSRKLRGNKHCFMNKRNTNDGLAKTARTPRIAAIWLDALPYHLRISDTLGFVLSNCRPSALYVLFSRGGSCQPSLGAEAGIVRHSFGRVDDLVFPPRTTILIHFLAATRWHHPDLLLCSCNRHKFSAPSQLKTIRTRKEIGPVPGDPAAPPKKRDFRNRIRSWREVG
jgi:hypothetical protein